MSKIKDASLINRIIELEEQMRKLKQKSKQADADYYVLYGVLVKKGIIEPEKFQKNAEKMLEEVEKSEQWLKRSWKKIKKN